jgi:hypothetical protein
MLLILKNADLFINDLSFGGKQWLLVLWLLVLFCLW